MGDPKEFPTMLSFCSGYGGIERGLELAGASHRVLAYVEIEAFAITNLVAKMEEGKLAPAPIWTDIKTFPAHLFRGCVDLIAGGYPCQPFSNAGKRGGEEDSRHLWRYIREHVRTIRPLQCFFENVEGHITLGLNSVISDLEEDGYDSTWGIFSANEVGAPHKRKRVFLLSNTNSSGFRQSHKENEDEPSDQLDGSSIISGTLTYADGTRLEGRIQGSITDEIGRQESKDGCTPERSDRRGWDRYNPWSFEPNLCRVVDGCSDRVDRIRLLGNGVVPQTAAKAWQILNRRLHEES